MKIGEIIEVEGVKYIAQEEILACKGCYFEYPGNVNCYKEFGCKTEDNVILVEIPLELLIKIEQLEKQIELMKNCENCEGSSRYNCSICENYDKWEMKRYTDEYMSAEDAEHWLYGELSSIINGGE